MNKEEVNKEEVINIWKEQCTTVRVVRSKTTFDPSIWQMFVLGHDTGKESVKEITIMKGYKYYWASANLVVKRAEVNGAITYVPDNITFELTEQQYNELVKLLYP